MQEEKTPEVDIDNKSMDQEDLNENNNSNPTSNKSQVCEDTETVEDEERKELEEEFLKVVKKEESLYEKVKHNEEIQREKKAQLKDCIKERYELEMESLNKEPVQIAVDNSTYEYIK